MQGGKKSSKKNKRLVKASMDCSTVPAGRNAAEVERYMTAKKYAER